MRLLTNHEIGILQGDLKKITLPKGVTVYVSLGLPNVFCRLDIDDSEKFENSWLYFPLEQLKSLRQNLIVTSNRPSLNYLSKEAIEVDDYKLYPILVKGKIVGVMAERAEGALNLPDYISSVVLDCLVTYEEQKRKTRGSIIRNFIATLFQYDSSFENFTKRLLTLCTDQYIGSCGGFYFEDSGDFKLRFAVGDITKLERLPAQLGKEEAFRWKDSIGKRDFLTTAEDLPPHPVFMTLPPDFLLVHPGIKSKHSDYLISLAVGGDIEFESMARIKELLEFYSNLHESQFNKSSEILGLYEQILTQEKKALSVDDLLLRIYHILQYQCRLARMTFIDGAGRSKTMVNRQYTEPTVVTSKTSGQEQNLFEKAHEAGFLFVSDTEDSLLGAEYQSNCRADNVRSEVYLPMNLPGHQTGYLIIGSTEAGDYLLDYRDFFERIRMFVNHVYNFYRQEDESLHIGSAVAICSEDALIARRFDTLGKLAGGLYHDIFSLLGVIMGQGEIVNREIGAGKSATTDKTSGSIQKMSQAADEITYNMGLLQKLYIDNQERFREEMSSAELLHLLPAMLHGFVRQIKDARNISLKIKAGQHDRQAFLFSLSEIYDYLLPVIISVMEHAESSGTVLLKKENSLNQNCLIIEFDRQILGEISPDELFEGCFPGLEIDKETGDAGKLCLSNLTIAYSFFNKPLSRIIFSKQSWRNPDYEEAGKPALARQND